MIFSNYDNVAINDQRKQILGLASYGIEAVCAKKIMKESVHFDGDTMTVQGASFPVKNKRIFVVGMGKVSVAMAQAIEEIVGDKNIVAGVVVSTDILHNTKKITVVVGDHPVPTDRSLAGARAIRALKVKYDIGEHDLVIALISGGGSALVADPVDGISIADKQKITQLLFAHGASGYENTRVKSVLSNTKGGSLASYFAPAHIISLVISDDNGTAGHHMTASGPFANIDIPVGEARAIIKRYNIEQDVPEAIMTFLHQEQIESEKNVYVSQYILSDNDMLVSSIKQRAELKGYHVESSVNMQGDVKEAAAHICKTIQDYVNDVPTLFVWGGETTIPIMGGPIGIGGRNQEFVLHCLKYFRENPVSYDWCVASIATDGVDHIPESCGGIVDNVSLLLLEKAKNNLNDVLNTHNAYAFLSEIGGNVYVKGQTNTNVGDIVMCMTAPK